MVKNELPSVPNNPDRSWHEVVERPNELAKKIPKAGGKAPEKAFKEAENIVRMMSDEYVEKLKVDIDQLKLFARSYRNDPSDANLEQVFRLVHNMRGQGATFGFPLITEIGRTFCRYVRERPETVRVKPTLVDQHLKALQVVYAQSIKGSGDEISRAVVRALNEVVEKEIG